jgi:hypothetical protein
MLHLCTGCRVAGWQGCCNSFLMAEPAHATAVDVNMLAAAAGMRQLHRTLKVVLLVCARNLYHGDLLLLAADFVCCFDCILIKPSLAIMILRLLRLQSGPPCSDGAHLVQTLCIVQFVILVIGVLPCQLLVPAHKEITLRSPRQWSKPSRLTSAQPSRTAPHSNGSSRAATTLPCFQESSAACSRFSDSAYQSSIHPWYSYLKFRLKRCYCL